MTRDELQKNLERAHGLFIRKRAAMRLFGFKTEAGFRRAQERGAIGVRFFPIQGRLGHFCMTAEVADWMSALVQNAQLAKLQEQQAENWHADGEAE